jgi:NAD+ synthase (glutamine-hydrolysing)
MKNNSLRIATLQFNPNLGHIKHNTDQIVRAALEAKELGADLLLTPELSLCGYPPEDLLFEPSFFNAINLGLDALLEIDGITMIIGHPHHDGQRCFNRATVLRDGNIIGRYDKMLLPNKKIFDECRYFTPGIAPLVFQQQGISIGVVICEDLWDIEPVAASIDHGAQLIVSLNASPYHRNKWKQRQETVRYRAEENQCPIIYCNLAGGQDELIFDGGSFALNRQGNLVWRADQFKESLSFIDYQNNDLQPSSIAHEYSQEQECYEALCLGLRDYVSKNGFERVILGLSGGIDSALVLAIATDALGSEHVQAVMMPSPYTSDISLEDAESLASAFNIQYDICPIWPTYESFSEALRPILSIATNCKDTTEENLQARIRGTLLMALSNRNHALLLATGNKSEMAVGYATLYGDMAGAFAPIKDLTKTWVYRLSQWHADLYGKIPQRVIDRPPSAELRPNQIDQDSLPPYDILDQIIEYYVEQHMSSQDLIQRGFEETTIRYVLALIKNSEYKRNQSAPGTRVTDRAFGKDWRYPLTHGFLS